MPGKPRSTEFEQKTKPRGRERRTTVLGPPGVERRSGRDRRSAFKIPIFVKFISLSTALTIVVSTVISVAILRRQVEDFRAQLISLGESLIRITAENAPDKLLADEDLALFQLVQDVAALDQVHFVLIADKDGRIKAHSTTERNGAIAEAPSGYTYLYDARKIRIGRFTEDKQDYLYFEKTLTYQTVPVGMGPWPYRSRRSSPPWLGPNAMFSF